MNNLVTISDKDYLTKALTLYESLKETQEEEFCLYLVCLDDVAYDTVKNIDASNAKIIEIKYFLE